jgi:hypothetical protein
MWGTDTAATARPDALRTGAPMQLMEFSFSSRSWAQPCSRTRASSARNSSREVMVLGVIRANVAPASTLSSSAGDRSAASTFPAAVECTGARSPIREAMRSWSCDSSLSM